MVNMLQKARKMLYFKKNIVYKVPPWGGAKPLVAHGLDETGIKIHGLLRSFI